MRRSSPTRSTRSRLKSMRLTLGLLVCGGMLSACAARPPAVVECPPAPAIPESFVSDESRSVNDFFLRVRTFLKKAADWSEDSMQTETPSDRH